MSYVLGRYECPSADFFDEACLNNDFYATEPPKIMSSLTANLMKVIDYESIREKRNRNWKYLDEKLKRTNLLRTVMPDVPFMYSYLISDVSEIREALTQNNIFVPTL